MNDLTRAQSPVTSVFNHRECLFHLLPLFQQQPLPSPVTNQKALRTLPNPAHPRRRSPIHPAFRAVKVPTWAKQPRMQLITGYCILPVDKIDCSPLPTQRPQRHIRRTKEPASNEQLLCLSVCKTSSQVTQLTLYIPRTRIIIIFVRCCMHVARFFRR